MTPVLSRETKHSREIEPCQDWENLSVPFKDFEEYKSLTGDTYEKAGKPFVVTLDKVLRGEIDL